MVVAGSSTKSYETLNLLYNTIHYIQSSETTSSPPFVSLLSTTFLTNPPIPGYGESSQMSRKHYRLSNGIVGRVTVISLGHISEEMSKQMSWWHFERTG